MAYAASCPCTCHSACESRFPTIPQNMNELQNPLSFTGGCSLRNSSQPSTNANKARHHWRHAKRAIFPIKDPMTSWRPSTAPRCLIESATPVRLEIVQITKRRGVAPWAKCIRTCRKRNGTQIQFVSATLVLGWLVLDITLPSSRYQASLGVSRPRTFMGVSLISSTMACRSAPQEPRQSQGIPVPRLRADHPA